MPSAVLKWLPKFDRSRTFARFFLPETRSSIRRFKTLRANTRLLLALDPAIAALSQACEVRSARSDQKPTKKAKLGARRQPSLRERAVALASANGEVRTREFSNIGVHRCYLRRMCDEGLLVKAAYGRYRSA